MGPWSKLDDLRKRVATAPLIDVGSSSGMEQAIEVLKKSGYTPERLVIMGWEVLLSRRRQDGVVRWHLSLKLHPHGRSSSEDDWKTIGRIAARIGAPRDPVIMPEDPHAAVHWTWIEAAAAS